MKGWYYGTQIAKNATDWYNAMQLSWAHLAIETSCSSLSLPYVCTRLDLDMGICSDNLLNERQLRQSVTAAYLHVRGVVV